VRNFYFHTPTSLDHALRLLDEHGEDARAIAGGTAAIVLMKQNLLAADHLVSLAKVPGLEGIRSEADGLHIGALTKHTDVVGSGLVRGVAPLLADVYSRVATVRVRNQATVGGGLAHADPAQDPPAAYIVLGASVRLVSRNSERTVPIDGFFTDYYETVIQPGELLTEVIVPPQPKSARATYIKYLPRTEDDYATVAVAALGETQGGSVSNVRVALIAAGSTPIHATAVEEALIGQAPTIDILRAAAARVAEQVDPIDDFRGSAEYKRDMAVVFTRRALQQVFGVNA
jgi:carbon-monoxide dehydrogenase medium subunit